MAKKAPKYEVVARQGDVLISRVVSVDGSPVKRTASGRGNRIILAEGEVTGHAHAIYQEGAVCHKTAVGTADEQIFVKVTAPGKGVAVEHEEHGTVWLQEGDYRIDHQREYTPEAIRRVLD